MKKLNYVVLSLVGFFAFGIVMDSATAVEPQLQRVAEASQADLSDRIVSPHDNNVTNGFDPRYLSKVNLKCGLTPLPPLGCKVGACVCDQNGNCQWTFICN